MNYSPLRLSALAVLVITLFQCEKTTIVPVVSSAVVPTVERLIFGDFHAFCETGKCADTYLLEDGQLFVDLDNTYTKSFPYQGNWSLRSRPAEQAMAASLLTTVPQEIWNTRYDVLGAPDRYDQGGYYLEVRLSDGRHRAWRLDAEYEVLPEFLWSFTLEMAEVLSALQEKTPDIEREISMASGV